MLLNITQLIVLFVLFLWVASKLTNKNKVIFYSAVAIFSLLLAVEASSVYLINQPFGYQYWINVDFDLISTYLFQFYVELGFAGAFIVLIFILCVLLSKKINRANNIAYLKFQWLVPVFCLIFLALPNGVFLTLLDLAKIQFSKVGTVEQSLTGIGISPQEYTFPDKLNAVRGKNIIVISMESLEKSFLNKHYAGEDLTPNLNRLAIDNKFYLMRQTASWTSGSLYEALTGIPSYFKTRDNGNLVFENIDNINFSTLGNVLNKAGYDSRYLMSDVYKSGGADRILKINHFQLVTNKAGENLGAFKSANDLDLFAEAKLQVDQLAEGKRPFALFLSTINSHFPRGIYDPRMEPLLRRKLTDFKNEVDFSVMATDYLVGNLIGYLEKKKLLDNTVFYIYPDHMMMGNSFAVQQLNTLGRGLYLLTNAKLKDDFDNKEKQLSQYDISRAIIDGSLIKSNVKFLSDFKGFNEKNISGIASLNAAIIAEKNFRNAIKINIGSSSLRIENLVAGTSKLIAIDEKTLWVNCIFNENMKLVDAINGDNKFQPIDSISGIGQPIQLTIFLDRLRPKSFYIGNYKNIGEFKRIDKNTRELYLQEEVVNKIVDANKLVKHELKYDPRLYISTINFKPTAKYIDVTSSEFTSHPSSPAKIVLDDLNFSIARGLNLLYWGSDDFNSVTFDTYGDNSQAKGIIEKLKSLMHKRTPYLLVTYDSLNLSWGTHQEEIKAIGLPVLSSVGGRVAYIGFFDGKKISEFTDPKTISRQFPVEGKVAEWQPPLAIPLRHYLQDTNRFIAHAGGKVDGKIYTDSLDALNESYAKGLRLFELDIIKTSDGVYVAAHDWEHWAKITGYKGALPPNSSEFLNYKIYQKFEPLDLARINEWFKRHPDAILVTDKVNDPLDFSNKFVDKKRLMMELFTLSALQDGIKAGILAPMISQDLWGEIYRDHRELITSKKIQYVAASRNIQRLPLRQMLNNGIKVYAFNINFQEFATEEWVACNERNLFYGMYIDDSKFLKMTECK